MHPGHQSQLPECPSWETMSLLSLFSDERCIDSREKVIVAMFTSVGTDDPIPTDAGMLGEDCRE